MHQRLASCLVASLVLHVVLVPAAARADGGWKPGPGAQGANTYAGVIDAPRDGSQVSRPGTLQVAGWLVGTTARGWSGIDDVEVFLGLMNDGGIPLAHALFALPRPDVATALNNPYWSASGWGAQIPTASLFAGSNELTVYAHSPEKGWWYTQVHVVVAQGASNLRPATTPGMDASFPECGRPLSANGLGFAIVGVNGGRAFTPNPCLAQE